MIQVRRSALVLSREYPAKSSASVAFSSNLKGYFGH